MEFKKIIAPTECPVCGSSLELVNAQLFCRNSECPAQTSKKVQHFCKVLKIKGFGETTLNKLGITHINELLHLDAKNMSGVGDKTRSNLINQVEDRLRRRIPVSEFIQAQSIPLVGSSLSSKLDGLDFDAITEDALKSLGAGDKATANLLDWLHNDWFGDLENHWAKYIDTTKTKTEGMVAETKGDVCITGKLNDFPNRNAAAEYLKTIGWNVKSSVTKTVKYLVCEDDTKINSSSYKKAQSLGIEILKIKDLEDK